jgi:hypothetical protein
MLQDYFGLNTGMPVIYEKVYNVWSMLKKLKSYLKILLKYVFALLLLLCFILVNLMDTMDMVIRGSTFMVIR